MKIVKYMQDGGQAPMPESAPAAAGAPAGQEGGAPAQGGGEEQMMQQLAQIAQQIIQEMGPDAAAMLAQIIMEMLQGAPQEVGAQPQEVGFQRKGGKICKKACGGKAIKK